MKNSGPACPSNRIEVCFGSGIYYVQPLGGGVTQLSDEEKWYIVLPASRSRVTLSQNLFILIYCVRKTSKGIEMSQDKP